jgi:hypothetical protein
MLLGVLSALYFWGFCVDDALISVRYAQHLGRGDGYIMSLGAAPSDGVTPLPFAFLLLPVVRGATAMGGLLRVKALGVLLHGFVAMLVARRVAKLPAQARPRGALLGLGMLFAVPSMAWAASGMEVELSALLVTLGVVLRARPLWMRVLLVGVGATLRPELGAFALGFGLALVLDEHGSSAAARTWVTALSAAVGPFVVVALVRLAWFGAAAPLSVAAKPSDFTHGAVYLGAALIASAVPFALLSPTVLRKGTGGRPVVVGLVLHAGAILAVGGDSMPLARLMVPVVPALFVVAIDAAAEAGIASVLFRTSMVLAIDVFGLTHWSADARRTLQDRTALTLAATPLLTDAQVVACVDIGWVSAAAPDATLVDLAGVTDKEIAYLPGGHTSKAISPSLLSARHVDTLLLLEKGGQPARVVEARLRSSTWVNDTFERRAVLPIGSTGLAYGVYVRRPI